MNLKNCGRLELPLPPLRFPGRRQGVLEGAHCNSQTETGFLLFICLYKSWYIASPNSFLRLGWDLTMELWKLSSRGRALYEQEVRMAVVKERSAEKVTIEILNKDRTSKVVQPSQTLGNGKCLKQKIWTSSSLRGSIKDVVRIFPIQPLNSPLHFVSSFCCPAFGGQTSLLSGAQVLQTPQYNFLQCPLHLSVQLLLPGIWRSTFSFLPINFFPPFPFALLCPAFAERHLEANIFFSPQ